MNRRIGLSLCATAAAALVGAACQPMQVGLVVDRVAYVGEAGASGSPVTLTGRALCSEPEALDLFVTITQNPDRRFHGERSIYCEGDTPFVETFEGTSLGTEEGALLEARLCTNRGGSDFFEDCTTVTRSLLMQPK